MKISELVKMLEKLKEKHGDLDVWTETLSHRWAPDPDVRNSGDRKFVVLNG